MSGDIREVLYDTGKPVAKITFFIGMERTNSYCEKTGGMSEESYEELARRLKADIIAFSKASRKALNDQRDLPVKFWNTDGEGNVKPYPGD